MFLDFHSAQDVINVSRTKQATRRRNKCKKCHRSKSTYPSLCLLLEACARTVCLQRPCTWHLEKPSVLPVWEAVKPVLRQKSLQRNWPLLPPRLQHRRKSFAARLCQMYTRPKTSSRGVNMKQLAPWSLAWSFGQDTVYTHIAPSTLHIAHSTYST